ncbi:SapC family protein [Thalassotalea agarivorans]|uniref:SapC protein n=1 Tax=Thalassotalea agarivorans TaxID=349064 RepID=A0A1I0E125_THASX|nr:SapC family protein [Thalassotalea agarivorans]SET38589.1 SapC protein [Thalassotalea agarivorans]
MATNALLNSVDHKNLKVITDRSAQYGDNVWFAMTFPAEFRSVQNYYPIFFQKDSKTGQFYAVALFGFEDKENLFLTEQGWEAGYIPLSIQRQPFAIAVQDVDENGEEKQQRMLTIDMDNPRVSETQGEALFKEYGGNTPYLDYMADMLEALHHGVGDSADFFHALTELDLIESVTVDLELNNKSQHQLVGFYTIKEESLATLTKDQLAGMHQKGYLQAIYMVMASQGNIRQLLSRKNKQLGL